MLTAEKNCCLKHHTMETKDECWPDGPLNLNADFTFTFAFIEYNGSNADKNQQSVRLSNGQKFLLAVMKI